MNLWLTILLCIVVVLYAIVKLMRPPASRMSRFETERRAHEGDARANVQLHRLKALPFINSLRAFTSTILILIFSSLLVMLTGGWGVVIAVSISLVIAWLCLWPPARRAGETLYGRIEPNLLRLALKRSYFFFLPIGKPEVDKHIDSEAELIHLLGNATFLEPERRMLIRSSLEFTGLSVSDAMSGRRSIKSVDKGEVLGPLVLDELYKTGKQAFVVTDNGLDTVVGILKLDRLTNLDMLDSPTALKAMDAEVPFITAEAPITDALSYLRSSKAPFLVVQDSEGKTAGLLTMDNILRCLFEAQP